MLATLYALARLTIAVVMCTPRLLVLQSAIDRVRRMMMWRSGQAAFKGFTTTGCLQLEATQLPPELLELVAEVAQVSNGYKETISQNCSKLEAGRA